MPDIQENDGGGDVVTRCLKTESGKNRCTKSTAYKSSPESTEHHNAKSSILHSVSRMIGESLDSKTKPSDRCQLMSDRAHIHTFHTSPAGFSFPPLLNFPSGLLPSAVFPTSTYSHSNVPVMFQPLPTSLQQSIQQPRNMWFSPGSVLDKTVTPVSFYGLGSESSSSRDEESQSTFTDSEKPSSGSNVLLPPRQSSPITLAVQANQKRNRERTWLPCQVCDKRFDRPSLLRRHMRTHTGEKPHSCDVCGKAFSTSSSLNTHRRIHSGEKPHQCGVCGKRFTASSNLYYHKMTHNKEKPHKCTLCSKSFPTPGDLKSHMYVHNGCWPFKCDVCNRGFSKQTNLKNHIMLHTGDKPHECQLCGKRFALHCNLKTHWKTHDGEAKETCVVCHQQFLASKHKLYQGQCKTCLVRSPPLNAVSPSADVHALTKLPFSVAELTKKEFHKDSILTPTALRIRDILPPIGNGEPYSSVIIPGSFPHYSRIGYWPQASPIVPRY